MYEAVQFEELQKGAQPVETVLGSSKDELEAIALARDAMGRFVESGSTDYAWWIVREQGADLANFIVDSKSRKEFVVDLRSGTLTEVRS